MNKIFHKDSTLLNGKIVHSTIDQLSLLGDVGNEILTEVDFKKINPEKFYPRIIRGKIHQKILVKLVIS